MKLLQKVLAVTAAAALVLPMTAFAAEEALPITVNDDNTFVMEKTGQNMEGEEFILTLTGKINDDGTFVIDGFYDGDINLIDLVSEDQLKADEESVAAALAALETVEEAEAGEDGESSDGESADGESAGDSGGGMPDTSLGGNATSRPPDNSTRAVDILGTRAALYFDYSEEDGWTVQNNVTPAYTVEGIEADVPGTDGVQLSGVLIECAAIDWDDEISAGNSGIVINARTDEDTTFAIGGADDNYEAPDGEKYNSVIVMSLDENEEYDTSAVETAAGCGIAFNGKSLLLNNVYVESNGTGRPSIHIPASTRDKNVSQMSDIICVDSTIVNHSTRAMLLMGGDVWFLNSKATTDSWGALSYDNTEAAMYVVNSISENTSSGYSIYDAAGCTVYVYGSRIVAPGTGITVCRNASLTVANLEDADETATAPYNGEADLMVPAATADGKSIIVGYEYPIKIHADMSGPDSVASAYIKDAYLSSAAEDLVLSDGTVAEPSSSTGGSVGSDAMNALVNEFQSGMIVEIACHNGQVVLDNCELNTRTGVIAHSFFAYDSMASGIYPVDGAEYAGDAVILKNMSAQGDILHDDYMRKMIVGLENAELTGKVYGNTLTGWNNYWKDQIEAINGDEDDAKLVIHDEEYTTLWGVRMSVDAESVWNVTGTSQLYSLTVEDGAVIAPAEGKTMTIYVDCTMDNALESYDISAGTQIDAFEPGVEYSGVVIVIE